MADVLVVVSKVKKMVKEEGLRTSEEFIEALSKKVEEMVKNAVEKVKSEGKKKTLGSEDLM
jgi:N-methylhydantoinase B/oxoprolinase/acetone carboxylase alpha subunit